MKEEINNLLQFIKKPTIGFDENGKVKRFFKILLIDIVLTGFVLGIMALLDQIDVIHNNLHHKANSINGIVLIVSAVIFAPILEEFVFRYFLVDNKINILRIFVRKKNKINTTYEYRDNYEEKCNKDKDREEEEKIKEWNRILPKALYILTLLFALSHINNYEINTVSILMMPLLLMTPIILGLLASYLRVKVNFGAAVALHMIHNMIFVSIGVLSGEFTATNDYKDVANIIQQISKDGINRKERIIRTYEYSLEITIKNKIEKKIESRIVYDSVLYSPMIYRVENYRMGDVYRDMKKFYREGMMYTNPAFLGEYDENLIVDIWFKRNNSTKIHSLDTVIHGIKETMTINKLLTM